MKATIRFGIFAPKTTPADIIARMHLETYAALLSPELLRRLEVIRAAGIKGG
jgi:tripartite-type tricarboxylate transporter receptor subunit TctC